MNKFIVVRKPIYTSIVEELLQLLGTWNYMKEFTMEKRPLHINNVGQLLLHPGTSKHMSKITLHWFLNECKQYRKPFCSSSDLWRHTETHLGTNPVYVTSVGKPTSVKCPWKIWTKSQSCNVERK
jgi:hypothetical protein